MKPNAFRIAVAEGRIPLGHLIWEFGTRGIAKIVEAAGADFVLLDMEHSAFGIERVADVLEWFQCTRVAPIVRVPQRIYHFLARAMDAGAMGVMVANVETAEEAREIVSAVKYAPLGRRGLGFGTAHTGFRAPDPVAYMQEANANTTVVCMIESSTGLQNAGQIAATPGVDVLWVGHYDLTQAMGIPGQFEHPRFVEALRHVVAAANHSGKVAGINPGTPEQAREWIGLGFRAVSWSTDIAVYGSALASAIVAVRAMTTTGDGA